MFKWLKDLLDLFKTDTDPVHHCEVHKTEGCAHVDGFLCNYPCCSILDEHKAKLQKQEAKLREQERGPRPL